MKVDHIKKKREKKKKRESRNIFTRRLPFELRRFPRIAGALQRAINDKSPFDVKAYRLTPNLRTNIVRLPERSKKINIAEIIFFVFTDNVIWILRYLMKNLDRKGKK